MSFWTEEGKRDVFFIVFVAILYVISLLLPAAYNADFSAAEPWIGFNFLTVGWLGVLGFWFAWYANPLLLWALIAILFKKYKQASFVSLVATLLSLQTLLIFSNQPVYVPDNTHLLGPGPSYWVWQSLLFAVTVYSFYFAQSTQQTKL